MLISIAKNNSAEVLEHVAILNQQIDKLQLWDIHERKPLLDGKVLCDMYGVKPGKIVKHLVEELFNFSILNPQATLAESQAHMVARKDELLAKFN